MRHIENNSLPKSNWIFKYKNIFWCRKRISNANMSRYHGANRTRKLGNRIFTNKSDFLRLKTRVIERESISMRKGEVWLWKITIILTIRLRISITTNLICDPRVPVTDKPISTFPASFRQERKISEPKMSFFRRNRKFKKKTRRKRRRRKK